MTKAEERKEKMDEIKEEREKKHEEAEKEKEEKKEELEKEKEEKQEEIEEEKEKKKEEIEEKKEERKEELEEKKKEREEKQEEQRQKHNQGGDSSDGDKHKKDHHKRHNKKDQEEEEVVEIKDCVLQTVEAPSDNSAFDLDLHYHTDYTRSVQVTIGDDETPFHLLPDTEMNQIIVLREGCSGCYSLGDNHKYTPFCEDPR